VRSLLVGLASLATACAYPRPARVPAAPPDDWEIAAEFAWQRLGGDGPAPRDGVIWIKPDAHCGPRGVWIVDHCVEGLHYTCDEIYVVRSADEPVSRTSLTHELLHCLLYRRGIEDGDGDHSRPEWRSVNEINIELRWDGL
jgi:hypothetical protein